MGPQRNALVLVSGGSPAGPEAPRPSSERQEGTDLADPADRGAVLPVIVVRQVMQPISGDQAGIARCDGRGNSRRGGDSDNAGRRGTMLKMSAAGCLSRRWTVSWRCFKPAR